MKTSHIDSFLNKAAVIGSVCGLFFAVVLIYLAIDKKLKSNKIKTLVVDPDSIVAYAPNIIPSGETKPLTATGAIYNPKYRNNIGPSQPPPSNININLGGVSEPSDFTTWWNTINVSNSLLGGLGDDNNRCKSCKNPNGPGNTDPDGNIKFNCS